MPYINQGGLWDNQRKFDPKDPDFVGSINVGGVEHKLVGWVSSSKHPQSPAINIKLSDPRPVPIQYKQSEASVLKEIDDEPPF
jgi:hypothetical protein